MQSGVTPQFDDAKFDELGVQLKAAEELERQNTLEAIEAEEASPKVTIKISSDMVDDAANTPLSYEDDGVTYTDGSSPI